MTPGRESHFVLVKLPSVVALYSGNWVYCSLIWRGAPGAINLSHQDTTQYNTISNQKSRTPNVYQLFWNGFLSIQVERVWIFVMLCAGQVRAPQNVYMSLWHFHAIFSQSFTLLFRSKMFKRRFWFIVRTLLSSVMNTLFLITLRTDACAIANWWEELLNPLATSILRIHVIRFLSFNKFCSQVIRSFRFLFI